MNSLQELYAALEFDCIVEKIKGYAASPLGSELVEKLLPLSSKEDVEIVLTQVSEMRALLNFDDPFPIDGIYDIREAIAQASHEGSMLPVKTLVEVTSTLAASRQVKHYLKARTDKYPQLCKLVPSLHNFRLIERAIDNAIDRTTSEIRDDATAELKAIRSRLRHAREKLRQQLMSIVEQYQNFLQEPIVTLREGRMVVPLKEEFKGRVPGLILGHSSSGATLFVEPMEVLEHNNHIRELEIEEQHEIERILRKLTAQIREQQVEIEESIRALAYVDLIYAKARFAQELGAQQPRLDEHQLRIVQGKHPLLLLKSSDSGKVVPLDLEMGKDFHTLVITGPNAGGKTVALKTIGLLSLMVHCGIPVPAEPTSQFVLFDQIFVDIGDWQSVEQDLSTFSARVEHLAKILTNATAHSLVLVDEVGSGTDPAEGAALAMAFLEELTHRGCWTVVTTHQGALKAFAYQLSGAQNGSMAFDEKTLMPTYQFRLGIPGSSYAFEIAHRFGFPAELVQKARQVVGAEQSKLENLIMDLEKKLNHYRTLLQQAEIKKAELEGLIKLYRQKYEELAKEERKLKKKAMEESQAILARANAVIEEAIREISTRQAEKDSIKQAKAKVETVRQEIEAQLQELNEKEVETDILPCKGDRARWIQMNVTGRVVSDPDSSGRVWLEAGDMRLKVPRSELRKLETSQETRETPRSMARVEVEHNISTELDLRGMTMEEAQPLLDKFLDRAYLAGLEQVRIIHGKGTGALRLKVQEYLAHYPRIARTHFAAWNEGDIGVTVVEFEKK
ncbi:MAG TPA: endonuclease MutS2 [Bacteroidetes bacterium]|nr:endonuclease MutS2 [Bacteroidota bacterium]